MSENQYQKNLERLFLLEFLVDHVVIYNSKLDLDEEVISKLGPVIVKFQFLTYPPIEIREEDFTPSTKPLIDEKRILLKSGRSCMFSLSSSKSKKICETDFDVFINVSRNKISSGTQYGGAGEDNNAETVFIGATKINMNDSLKILLCQCDSPDASDKMTHTKTAAQNLMDEAGYNVGKIVFLIRVSAFGYMVVTGFQLNDDEKNFKYKNITEIQHSAGIRPSKDTSKKDKDKDKSSKEKSHDERKSKEGEKSKELRPSSDTRKAKKIEPGRETCPYGYPIKPVCQCCPCQRAAAWNKYQGQVQGQGSIRPPSFQGQPNQGQYPQSLAPSLPGQSVIKDIDMDPGSVAIRGNQLVFKMPEKQTEQVPVEGKFASSVYYTMGDEKKEGPRNVIQILPQNPLPAGHDEGLNDRQDVLVLKLGKKRLAAGKKPKLEVELRTPKMKREKPETDTQATQYSESDIPKPPKPKSAGGSKAGKKGKK